MDPVRLVKISKYLSLHLRHQPERLGRMQALAYNDLSADRNVVAAVQAMEAILDRAAHGRPGCQVTVNSERGGLVVQAPGSAEITVLYEGRV